MAIPIYTYLTKMYKLLYLQEQVQENKYSDFKNKINCLVPQEPYWENAYHSSTQ